MATNMRTANPQLILGCLEAVSLPQIGVTGQVAKIDTGAYSGALHATNIRIIRRGLVRKRWLKFTPLGDPTLATETDHFIRVAVRSSNGQSVKRYLIDTEIIIQGRSYPVRIGLSDRSELKRTILIGRRFLREHNFLVDVRIHQQDDDEGENS